MLQLLTLRIGLPICTSSEWCKLVKTVELQFNVVGPKCNFDAVCKYADVYSLLNWIVDNWNGATNLKIL